MKNRTDNIIPFTSVGETKEDNAIVINHGIRTLEAVKNVSDYIRESPLNNEQNDKLINLLKDQLIIAEHETYIQGFMDCSQAIQEGNLQVVANKIVKVEPIKYEKERLNNYE